MSGALLVSNYLYTFDGDASSIAHWMFSITSGTEQPLLVHKDFSVAENNLQQNISLNRRKFMRYEI